MQLSNKQLPSNMRQGWPLDDDARPHPDVLVQSQATYAQQQLAAVSLMPLGHPTLQRSRRDGPQNRAVVKVHYLV